ncbi:MAG: copper chaperone PCu(A)C [Devosia sp.]
MIKRIFLLAAVAALLGAATGTAHEIASGTLTVIHPFVRATLPGAVTGGGYMTIRNDADEPDTLLAIEAPGTSAKVTLHQTIVSADGTSTMAPLSQIVIPAHSEVTIGAEGTHLMFEDIAAPFGLGEILGATLIFERYGRLEITLEVEPFSADPLDVIHAHASH